MYLNILFLSEVEVHCFLYNFLNTVFCKRIFVFNIFSPQIPCVPFSHNHLDLFFLKGIVTLLVLKAFLTLTRVEFIKWLTRHNNSALLIWFFFLAATSKFLKFWFERKNPSVSHFFQTLPTQYFYKNLWIFKV